MRAISSNSNHPRAQGWKADWPLVLPLAFMLLMGVRAVLVEAQYADYVGCPGCFRFPSFSADGWLLAIIGLLAFTATRVSSRWFGALLALVPSVLVLLYIADLFIVYLFGIRLFFVDVATFGLDTAIIWDQFSGRFGGALPAALLAVGIIGLCLAPAALSLMRQSGPKPLVSGHVLVPLLALLTGLGIALLPASPPDYANNWIYKNFLQANLASTERVTYSPEQAERHLAAWRQRWPDRCIETNIDRRNVVVVAIESWSNYQSLAFGGLEDWTPGLDLVAHRYQRYTNFHAGGFSTNEGLVNILAGARLWAPFSHLFESAEFDNLWGLENSLPARFNRHGFHTAFLTTGPLAFQRKGEWLKSVGFDHVEGNEHPFYADWPRISFQAPGDEALYRRTLDWIDETGETPFLAVLQTVTTHQPYINPDTGERDIAGAFRYVDRWTSWFYEQLRARGFFEDGVLFITSDHRAMHPVSEAEMDRYGPAAVSLIPLIVIDDELESGQVVDQVHKLSDIMPSLSARLDGGVCLGEFEASLFESPPHAGNCAFHLRGSERGIVDVFCNEGRGQVRLKGDDTHFRTHEGLDADRRARILDAIARDRLQPGAPPSG